MATTAEFVELSYPRETHSTLSISLLKIFNVASYVTLVTVTVLLAETIFGHDLHKIAQEHPSALTPAKIFYYLSLSLLALKGLFVVYQALPLNNYHVDLYLHKLSIFLSTTWLLQAGSAIAFGYEVFWLSGLLLLLACITNYIAYFRLQTAPIRLMPLIFNNTYYWSERYHITHRYGGVLRRDVVVEENEAAPTVSDKLLAVVHYILVFLTTSVNLALLVFGVFGIAQLIFPGMNTFGWNVANIIILGTFAAVHIFWQQDILFASVIIYGLITVAAAEHDIDKQVSNTAWIVSACVLTMWLFDVFVLQPWWTFKTDRRAETRREREPLVNP